MVLQVTPVLIHLHYLQHILSGSKYPQNTLFNFEKRSTGCIHMLQMSTSKAVFVKAQKVVSPPIGTSVAVLAEIPLRSPRKLINFIIKKIFSGSEHPRMS